MKLIPLIDMTGVMLLQLRQTASANGTGIDLKDYDGPAVVALNVHNVSGTTPTLAIAFTESDTQGGTYTAHSPAVSSAAYTTVDGTELVRLGDVSEWKRWLRAETTAGGTSPVYDCCAIFIGSKKYN